LLGTKGTASFSAFAVNPYQSAPVALYLESDPAELPPDLAALYRPERWWGEGRPGWIEFWPPRENTFQRQYEAFFEAVDGGAAPPVGGEDGYRALEIVMAAYLSLRERRPVKLPLDPDIEIAPPAF
jgi:predicted dehydrogenase